MRKRIASLLVLLGVLVGVAWASHGCLRIPALLGEPGPAVPQGQSTEAGPPQLTHLPSADNAALSTSRVLIEWDDVPADIAMMAPPFGSLFGKDAKRGAMEVGEWVANIRSLEKWGQTREAAPVQDQRLRALGMVACLDTVIARKLGWTFDDLGIGDQRHYFPLPTVHDLVAPSAAEARRQIRALLDAPKDDLIESIPGQHRGRSLDDAIRARLTLMLGALGPDETTASILREQDGRFEGNPRQRAATALALAMMGDASACSAALGTDGALARDVLGGLANFRRRGEVIAAGQGIIAVTCAEATVARELDAAIVRLLRAENMETQRLALRALASRCDQPPVSDAVLEVLETTQDETRICEVLAGHPALWTTPRYRNLLLNWLHGDRPTLSYAAVTCLGSVPDPLVVEQLVPLLRSADGRMRTLVADALFTSGAMDPARAIQALEDAAQVWRSDQRFVTTCSNAQFRIGWLSSKKGELGK